MTKKLEELLELPEVGEIMDQVEEPKEDYKKVESKKPDTSNLTRIMS